MKPSRLVLALLLCAWLVPALPVHAQSAGSMSTSASSTGTGSAPGGAPPADPDHAMPGGAFYTESAPGRSDGGGYAVVDGQGVQMWTAFQSLGGLPVLGLPITRRFEWDGAVAQAFQHGILRWDDNLGRASIVPPDTLPGHRPPDYAFQTELPPHAEAEVQPNPWSGWWWPASTSAGPSLLVVGGPLDKYDQFVQTVTGDNPGTRAWERDNIFFPSTSWAGHCNGFAAASLLEPEPTAPRTLAGITFGVADQKALLSDYHFGDGVAWSYGSDGTVSPADFQHMLLDWVGASNGKSKGFVLTYDMGHGEVWSYPLYKFQSTWQMDPDTMGLWHVKTTVWMADMDVPSDFVGLKPYPGSDGQTFEYTLIGDPRHPSGGEWTGASASGRFSHPGQIWYPDPKLRNADRDLTSPGLDLNDLHTILAAQSDGSAV
jgi:hypothetical protein